MSDQNTADTGAQDTQTAQETDPFAGFQSESYEKGERTDNATADNEPAPVAETSNPDEQGDGQEGGDPTNRQDGDDDGDGAEPPAAPPKKQTAQERINELTRARREAERRAEALERQLREREQAAAPPEPPAQPQPQQQAAGTEGPPNPDDYDFGELDSRYIAALVDYQTDQRLAAFRAEQEQEAQQTRAQKAQEAARTRFQQQVEEGSKVHEDFYERVVIGAEKNEWPLSAEMGQMLVESEVGHNIAYHLATNPEEAARVYRQSPTEQARYFGRLEARFSAEQSAAHGTPPADKTALPRTPRAPAPVLPTRGAGGTFQASATSEDFASFERAANAPEKR